MRKLLPIVIVCCLLFAMPAAADTINYTVTGTMGTITFSLPVNPSPDYFSGGSFFTFLNLSTSIGVSNVVFYNSSAGGGLVMSGFNLYGPQLYSGPESNPTLLTGTFEFDSGLGSPAIATAAVAEPVSLVLLGTGLLGIAARYRKKLI